MRAHQSKGSVSFLFAWCGIEKYDKDCFLTLSIDKHGLYDLVDAIFHHQLYKMSGDGIHSHLWKIKFADIKCNSMLLLLLEFGSMVCERRIPESCKHLTSKRDSKACFVENRESLSLSLNAFKSMAPSIQSTKLWRLLPFMPASTHIQWWKERGCHSATAVSWLLQWLEWLEERSEMAFNPGPTCHNGTIKKIPWLHCFSREIGISRNLGLQAFSTLCCIMPNLLPHGAIGTSYIARDFTTLNVLKRAWVKMKWLFKQEVLQECDVSHCFKGTTCSPSETKDGYGSNGRVAACDCATYECCNYGSNATFDFNLVILKMQCGLFKGVLACGCGWIYYLYSVHSWLDWTQGYWILHF